MSTRTLLVVGIGAGDPDQVTVQAIKALARVDVVFVVDKGDTARELLAVREEIRRRYVTRADHRVVPIADPPRDREAGDYGAAVASWRERRAEAWERAIADELGPGQCGAFLVWGDPSLYDATIDVLDAVLRRGAVTFAYEVIPGISSIQALAAHHRVSLNRVGGAIEITTGRRLRAEGGGRADDIVVMLDRDEAFRALSDEPGTEIFWGAYLGMPEELLLSGPLVDMADEIARVRADARERAGWIMDTYLLRR